MLSGSPSRSVSGNGNDDVESYIATKIIKRGLHTLSLDEIALAFESPLFPEAFKIANRGEPISHELKSKVSHRSRMFLACIRYTESMYLTLPADGRALKNKPDREIQKPSHRFRRSNSDSL